MKKILLIFISTILVAGFIYFFQPEIVKAGAGHNVWGWAWNSSSTASETGNGWMSFNSTNTGAAVDYGVNIDSNGILSGYAWMGGGADAVGNATATIGWVSFADFDGDGDVDASDKTFAGSSCTPNCEAKISTTSATTTWEVSGWARALAGLDPQAGGWDGWIKLRGQTSGGEDYGVWIDTGVDPVQFHGWAWGGDDSSSTAVIGWISFNCAERGVCGTSNYKVLTSFGVNQRPSATPLPVTYGDYCFAGGPPIFLSWQFSDPNPGDTQSAYRVQIDVEGDGTWNGPNDLNSGKILSSSNSYSPATLPYGLTNADWRVRVWDNKNATSSPSWANGPNFQTAAHAYPWPDFTPPTITVGTVVSFKDLSECYSDPATTSCPASPNTTYSWNFGANSNPPTSAYEGNATTTYTSTGQNIPVTLTITNDVGQCSETKTLNVKPPLPDWKEIPPIIWLKNFFASVGNFFREVF